MKLQRVDEHLKEKLKDPYFKELYELEEQKLKIVKRIIAYRLKYKLSQKELAEKIGVTQQHISKIENGEFSSIATLERVLLFIGYTVKMQAIPLSQNIKHRIERLIHCRRRAQFA
jgi:transcriptional regulator with XRE-family HTH domain